MKNEKKRKKRVEEPTNAEISMRNKSSEATMDPALDVEGMDTTPDFGTGPARRAEPVTKAAEKKREEGDPTAEPSEKPPVERVEREKRR